MKTDTISALNGFQAQLQTLYNEHRDLGEAIAQLQANPQDATLVSRMRQHRLTQKDRIATIECLLKTREPAKH